MARPFSVDIPGLLAALTQQFPEPLLCIRELVQNAADAGARRIDVELAFDPRRAMLRLSVGDDGRGMGAAEVETYLTIGSSKKDPTRDRGRFGIGKLSPYALGIERMVVKTTTPEESHRLTFGPEGSGKVEPSAGGNPGTEVRIYKRLDRDEAETWVTRVRALLEEHCGQLPLDLRFNGQPIRGPERVGGRYMVAFDSGGVQGRLGLSAQPVFRLSSGGLLLESGTALFGPEVSYALDSQVLAPTLSRNAARRDQAFEGVVREARRHLGRLATETARELRTRVELLETLGAVERGLDEDDRTALEWLRRRLMDRDGDVSLVEEAPVLETADGGLVSWRQVRMVSVRGERLPVSRVPRSATEVDAYSQRDLPVLLLYRDVEDFLDQSGISTQEVDASEGGKPVEADAWTVAEAALLRPIQLRRKRRSTVLWPWVAGGSALAGAALILVRSGGLGIPAIEAMTQGLVPVSGPYRGLAWLMLALSVGLGLASLARLVAPDRIRILKRVLAHPRDFWVARWSAFRSTGAAPTPGFVEARDAEPVAVGRRVDLDEHPLGLIELGDGEQERLLVLRADIILLNRRHSLVRRLVDRAQRQPIQARMLLENLIVADPAFAGGADPRRLEWDLLVRHQAWLRRLGEEA
ncbi:MAG: ATP-binding protein [Myxococcota bacterium]